MPESVIAFYVIFLAVIVAALFRPWVGVVGYTLFSIWFPHAVWPWIFRFSNFRVSYLIAIATIAGLLIAIPAKRVDFSVLKTRQNFYLFTLWLCLVVSYFMSPYDVGPDQIAIRNPDYLINNMSKVILFYFVSVLLIDTKQKFHFYAMIILFCAVFYICWGNMEYLQGHLRGLYQTLIGPGWRSAGIISPYFDENCFAMLYVVCIPFLFFMGAYYKNRFVKYFLWLNIPFAWHCIFLTGSRGGLLGLGVVSFYIMIRSKKKIFMVLVPLALVIAFIFQAGDYMKGRALRALNVSEEGSAKTRFESWSTGGQMIMDQPITGVGPGQFMSAYPDYADTTPYVAHNTIIQFTAESGIFAGLLYLLICFGVFKSSLNQAKAEQARIDPLFQAVNESIAGSMTGFFVCGLFLNLATYETLYYLLALNVLKNKLVGSISVNQSYLERRTEDVT